MAIFEFDSYLVLVGHKVRREKTTVKLHAFHDIDGRFVTTTFLNRDYSILSNLQKGIGKHLADRGIIIPSNRCHLLNFLAVFLIE